MADKPSWRDRDRRADQSRHRQEERPRGGATPRVESATAAYKRQLDALFEGSAALPAHLKEKLGDAPAGEAGERQKRLRAVMQASGGELVKALDAFLAAHEMPDDLEFVERALAHPKDAVLLSALGVLEAHLQSGKTVARKALLKSRLEEVELSSFDPRVQQKAAALAARLR
ncbi:MAG: hypothetical protein KC549_01040 [Myxococcales bacterium]|nr:hypothetical protein [Myxococcales bacterium]MCB9544870.1 hypothetical protein [Myxococcales bacterium]